MSYEQYRPSGFGLLTPVVKNLLIINGIFFLATWVLENKLNIDLTEILGLHYFDSDKFSPYQFITYMFMHGSLMHIFFNMFALWMFGNVLENYWGSKRFFVYYFVTGIGAALIHMGYTGYEMMKINSAMQAFGNTPSAEAFMQMIKDHFPGYEQSAQIQSLASEWISHPGDNSYTKGAMQFFQELINLKKEVPVVGASGAVFGILLAFGMMFPNTLLYVYFAIPIKAKYFVIIYGLIELFGGLQNAEGDNVAHFAHLGGMLFGFILIKYWQRKINRYQ